MVANYWYFMKKLILCIFLLLYINIPYANCSAEQARVIIHNNNINKIKLFLSNTDDISEFNVVSAGEMKEYCINKNINLIISTNSLFGDTAVSLSCVKVDQNIMITTPCNFYPDIFIFAIP